MRALYRRFRSYLNFDLERRIRFIYIGFALLIALLIGAYVLSELEQANPKNRSNIRAFIIDYIKHTNRELGPIPSKAQARLIYERTGMIIQF